jgi:hypothetical protein
MNRQTVAPVDQETLSTLPLVNGVQHQPGIVSRY